MNLPARRAASVTRRRRGRGPFLPGLTGDPLIDFANELVRDFGHTPAETIGELLSDTDRAEFVAYLKATSTRIPTMRALATAWHRFECSRASSAALARLDAEIAGEIGSPTQPQGEIK